jgi:uncharacterized coiled-coil protein SlyX
VASAIEIPEIPSAEQTPAVMALMQICTQQQEQNAQQQEQIHLLKEQVQSLRDEIARLKGNTPKPKIKPSNLDKDRGKKKRKRRRGKRPGSAKRNKTSQLQIHETVPVPPEHIPEGSRFKGYEDYTVQDITFGSHNTLYRLERWETPEGETIVGKLPDGVSVNHFGVTLVSFILYQYYHAHVTQPLLLEQLWEVDVDISSGQLNRIITEGKQRFHEEKDEILRVGLEVSPYIHVDDTGARHKGKNGYATHIGNELFAWFQSTDSKSRINFLELLRASHTDYVVNAEALAYMRAQKLPQVPLAQLAMLDQRRIESKAQFEALLQQLDIRTERHIRIATEGALLGSVLEHGLQPDLVVISDDAGQFDLILILHALCWIHAERTIHKLVGFNDQQRVALEQIRTRIWDFYDDLKVYKNAPSRKRKAQLQSLFDDIFTTKTCFATLNAALKRLHQNKSELLLVLDHPDIPLHNNLSETDIREYVKKRKISGSTRSEHGRRCRDSFASLKKTCRKLGVSFWSYLKDRISGNNSIAPLPDLIR